jgi:fatty-acyl-CoA synthase
VSLARWIERHAAFTPDRVALRCETEAWTYAELANRIERLAAGLQREVGLGHGDRIAWLGLNHPDMLALLFACARLGAILVPLNWRLAAPELRAILADAEPKALVVETGFRDRIEPVPSCHLIGCDFSEDGWTPLAGLCEHRTPAGEIGAPEDAILIVYTSGTTGRAKGAVLSQSALLWNALNSAHMHDLTSADELRSQGRGGQRAKGCLQAAADPQGAAREPASLRRRPHGRKGRHRGDGDLARDQDLRA